MNLNINYSQEFEQSIEESLTYANMSSEEIIDAITELEGNNWFDSTDIAERA